MDMHTQNNGLSAKVASFGLRRARLPAWMLTVVVCLSSPASAVRGGNQILGIDINRGGDSRVVRIRTSDKPTFTVFRLSDPMRVVVDISGGDLSRLDGPITVEDGVVAQVATRQFSSDGFTVGRIIVGFEKTVTYNVEADGNSVLVKAGDAPHGIVDSAAPPPVAPIDRAAAERYELAKKQAERAALLARRERESAEHAAARSKEQQLEAKRLAQQAGQARQEAEQAKAQAEALRQKVSQAVAEKRAAAEEAAREAEDRLERLQRAEQEAALARGRAERTALQAQQAQRDAEETAARAEARHKTQLAELQTVTAKAQKERAAAEQAKREAQRHRAEADLARRKADKAQMAAEKSRAEIAAKLVEIERREQRADRIRRTRRARQRHGRPSARAGGRSHGLEPIV